MIKRLMYAGLFLLMAGFGFQAFAQDEPAVPPAAEAATENPFEVPEGNDSQVLSVFLQKLSRTPPAERTPEGIKAHLLGLDGAVAEIMTREIEEDLFASAAEVRMQILSILPQFGDATSVAKRAKLLDQLKHDERAIIKEMVSKYELAEKLGSLATMSAEDKQALVVEVSEKIQKAPAADLQQVQETVQMAMQVAQTLERSGDTETAIAAYNLYAKYIDAKGIPQAKDLVERMQSTVRRLELLGNSMEVVGTTFEGEKFDIKQLQGKTVLVDFWATWCGPCRAELPNVKNLYEAYHEKGFEVVGISLDDDKEALTEFLDDQDIEWITLFEPNPEQQGWDNPISSHYGISGIPTAILVGPNGKVLTLNARGPELAKQLEGIYGPAEAAEEPNKPGAAE